MWLWKLWQLVEMNVKYCRSAMTLDLDLVIIDVAPCSFTCSIFKKYFYCHNLLVLLCLESSGRWQAFWVICEKKKNNKVKGNSAFACLCLFIFSARPLGHQSQLALVEKQFNEACKSHAPNQGACLCARLSRWAPPQSDLIAEYISHPGENERFTVTGRPRSSEEPWAGINLHNPARWFVKE